MSTDGGEVDPAFDAALWSFKGDKILDRRAWITHFASSGLPEARIRGWMAVIGVYPAISYTFHGKRPDRVRQYVELALECLDRR